MHICPVCGYPKLLEPPRSPSGGGSYEICPSCGFQFGVDDDDRGRTYGNARKAWQEAGMRWSSKGIPAPKGWNAQRQILALNPARKSPVKSAPKPATKTAKEGRKEPAKRVAKQPAKKNTAARAKKAGPTARKKPRNRR